MLEQDEDEDADDLEIEANAQAPLQTCFLAFRSCPPQAGASELATVGLKPADPDK